MKNGGKDRLIYHSTLLAPSFCQERPRWGKQDLHTDFWMHLDCLRNDRKKSSMHTANTNSCLSKWSLAYPDSFFIMDYPLKNRSRNGLIQQNTQSLSWTMTQVTRSEDVLFLFTVTAHQRYCSVIFLTQNLSMPGKYARSISLNCHYVIVFRNFRDNRSVISGFGALAYPGKTKYFKDAYEKATSQPYGYLVNDMTVTTPNEYRLRTRILSNEDTHVFVSQ